MVKKYLFQHLNSIKRSYNVSFVPSMLQSEKLGTEKISKLLLQQALPAAIGFMVMSVNMVVDTYFVGQHVGKLAIGAISIGMPISFLISSFGMAVGIGGSSIVSRALGAKEDEKAQLAFNNQISLTTIGSTIVIALGFLFKEPILQLFGAKGELMEFSDIYFSILLVGMPFLTGAMMANSNLRAEGKAKMPMMVMLILSISNIIFDYIFIVQMDWGMAGAGWATSLSYILGGSLLIFYYLSGKTELKVIPRYFVMKWVIIKEIISIGMVSLFRQGSISILTIILNHLLFYYGNLNGIGGEDAISVYGIVNRIAMFAFFPLIGIAQGLMPIVGYNYGAKQYDRVKEVVYLSLKVGFLLSTVLCFLLLYESDYIPKIFTKDQEVLLRENTSVAIFWIFLATPVLIFQLVGATYYQAIGKGIPALLLTLTKQGFFLIPILFIMPYFYNLEGIWYSFPMADVLAAVVCYYFLMRGLNRLEVAKPKEEVLDSELI